MNQIRLSDHARAQLRYPGSPAPSHPGRRRPHRV